MLVKVDGYNGDWIVSSLEAEVDFGDCGVDVAVQFQFADGKLSEEMVVDCSQLIEYETVERVTVEKITYERVSRY